MNVFLGFHWKGKLESHKTVGAGKMCVCVLQSGWETCYIIVWAFNASVWEMCSVIITTTHCIVE